MKDESRMSAEQFRAREERLDDLLSAYQAACEPGEVSVNFMPELWHKIETVQKATFSFKRIAKSFGTAAAVLSLLLAVIGFVPVHNGSSIYASTYVEALAAHNEALAAHAPAESVQYALELAHPDLSDDGSGEI
jgi:hypothetical protein